MQQSICGENLDSTHIHIKKIMIYKTFKIANQVIQTKIVNSLEGGAYGKFNDAKNQITLAKTVEIDDEVVELTPNQIENTFFHELMHVFQYYYNNEYDEAQAQVFANFMCEMLATGEVDKAI